MTATRGAGAAAASGSGEIGGGGSPYLIIGLGNPGKAYEATRHNAGFCVLDSIAEKTRIGVHRKRAKSLVGEGRYEGRKLVLIKPQTYMNLSGEAVAEAVRYYGPAPERLILVYDDADLPFATIRLRPYGSPGTHNGMRSVAEFLGGWKFPRVRVGIGAPPGRMDIKDYVLARMTAEESGRFSEAVDLAAAAALDIALLGIEKAMNLHNPQRSAARNSAGGEGAAEGGNSVGGRDARGNSGGGGDAGGGKGNTVGNSVSGGDAGSGRGSSGDGSAAGGGSASQSINIMGEGK
ncbi:MAG: aminoacyl-tRNA hydrolase [Clostridiales bacterium]|jgi:PTH1 family peptidyl-tRNA hydrolase|nr:aminoacyl-tRNA hydrolase [Clostridiales bacterium]